MTGRLEGLEGQECGNCPTDEVGDGTGEGVDEVEEGKEEDTTENTVRLGDLCAFLELRQHGVFGELRVEKQG